MNDYNHSHAARAADNDAAVAAPDGGRTDPRRKRCAQCGRPFGLVRRRRGGMQFCSSACLNEQAESARNAFRDKARWFEFLSQRG